MTDHDKIIDQAIKDMELAAALRSQADDIERKALESLKSINDPDLSPKKASREKVSPPKISYEEASVIAKLQAKRNAILENSKK